MTRILLDSWAWLEMFSGSPKGEKVRKEIKAASELLTTAANLYEVLYRTNENAGTEAADKAMEFIETHSQIVEIGKQTAIAAAEIRRNEKLHALDAFTLAASRLNEAQLVTGDPHFKNVKNVIFIE